ncbi:hypothetical protein [Crystallibacter degradans]|uniref:hypothetical protein n=1 Tax=Crystallibacter degradans TaxID=2726743 RepID=UPI00147290D7|nr:hypothetical protein [Arthrobacter sp. SF27]NMR30912.1 hypothetical protein [Arthrobacter sp. SF27]
MTATTLNGRKVSTVAPFRREPEGVLHADMLPSACPDTELATESRRDPYWDRLWAPGSQAVWTTASMVRQRIEEGSAPRKEMQLTQDEALEKLLHGYGWKEKLACWAVLDSWRTVTAEQMAAITGRRYLSDERGSSVSASFATGIMDIGTFPNPLATKAASRAAVYRPGHPDVFDNLIRPRLTWPEELSVTGGGEWSNNGLHDRHNILATELCLRAAEYLPLGAVLGEKYATVDLLAGSGLGKRLPETYQRRADGVLVRDDGLRIAIELTATTGDSFKNKVRKWAELMTQRPLETSGLTVLFVAAPHPDRTAGGKDPRAGIYRTLAEVLRSFPGTGEDSPAARIGVANWEEWFPGRHLMSEAFFTLKADFALNDAKGPGKWVARELLGDYPFTPWETFDATAVIENAPLLAATPYWMRAGDYTRLIGSPSSRAGVELVHKAPARPEKVKGRALGEAVGAAGKAKLPDRLRITG